MRYDTIIIGAGLYGLYGAIISSKKGRNVLVIETEREPFKRATYINQARVHMGYHYPRSLSTAIRSKGYFTRFCKDYSSCIHKDFQQIYATSSDFSWTNASQFQKFCDFAAIPCEEVPVSNYFNPSMCSGAFLTTEYTYDAMELKEKLLTDIAELPNVTILYQADIISIEKTATEYILHLLDGTSYSTGFLLNATYAGTNQIHHMLGYEPFKIKYELCEIILCKVSDNLKNTGLTVMDGPFFSIMPFGKTGYHSLTAVAFTPHVTSYDTLPHFSCQKDSNGYCSETKLGNCNHCPAKPKSAWPYMSQLAKKYMKDSFKIEYVTSLFSMKPILMASELDDSRPTVLKTYSDQPTFVSVLSGKINTVYDLDEVIK